MPAIDKIENQSSIGLFAFAANDQLFEMAIIAMLATIGLLTFDGQERQPVGATANLIQPPLVTVVDVAPPTSTPFLSVDGQPPPNKPASLANMQANRESRLSFRLSPSSSRRHFGIGVQDFFDAKYVTALKSLEAANQNDPKNALYVYFIGLAQLRSGKRELAMTTVAKAVAMEVHRPICDWGTRMERVQGPHRTWLENARTTAGLGPHAR